MAAKKKAAKKDNSGKSYQERYEKRISREYTKMLGEVGTGKYSGPSGARRFEKDMKKEGFNKRGDYSKSKRAYGPDSMVGQLRRRVQAGSGDLASSRAASRATTRKRVAVAKKAKKGK